MSEPETQETVLSVLRQVRENQIVNFPDGQGDPEFVTFGEAFVRAFAPDGYSRRLPWQFFEQTERPILDAAQAVQEIRNVTNQNRADLIAIRQEIEEIREISEGTRSATQNTLSLLFRQFDNAFVDDRVNVILDGIRAALTGQVETQEAATLSAMLTELTSIRQAQRRLVTTEQGLQLWTVADLLYQLAVCACEEFPGETQPEEPPLSAAEWLPSCLNNYQFADDLFLYPVNIVFSGLTTIGSSQYSRYDVVWRYTVIPSSGISVITPNAGDSQAVYTLRDTSVQPYSAGFIVGFPAGYSGTPDLLQIARNLPAANAISSNGGTAGAPSLPRGCTADPFTSPDETFLPESNVWSALKLFYAPGRTVPPVSELRSYIALLYPSAPEV